MQYEISIPKSEITGRTRNRKVARLADNGIKAQLQKSRAEDRAAQLAKAKGPAQPLGISDESLHKAEQLLKLL